MCYHVANRVRQVFLQPPVLQLTSEVLPGVSTQPLQNWMLLLRFDLTFLQARLLSCGDVVGLGGERAPSQEVPNLSSVELSLPIASVSPAANAAVEVHAATVGPGARLPWRRGQQVCLYTSCNSLLCPGCWGL